MCTVINEMPINASTSKRVNSLTDEQLLLSYRETGDREDFAELVRRYETELYNYLRRYLGDAELAEDAFQTAFLQVHLKSHTFDENRKFRPWLYAVATNQAIDAQRRNKKHRNVSLDRSGADEESDSVGKLLDLLVSEEVNPLDQVSLQERQRWVRQALNDLPEGMRRVVELVYFQGLLYREAAEILSVPVGTIKSRLHTAIFQLNQAWHNAFSE